MDLLTNLLNKEIIDLDVAEGNTAQFYLQNCLLTKFLIFFFPKDNGTKGQLIINSTDVCILGLQGILPLMSVETLKFPTLCSRFYTVSSFI